MKKHAILFFMAFIVSACASSQSHYVIKNAALSSGNGNGNGKNGSAKEKEVMLCPAPTAFQDVGRIMKSPGYWIAKLQNPDKVILNSKEIEAINAKTSGKSIYLTEVQYFPAKYYRKSAESMHRKMVSVFSKYYDGYSDKPVDKNYFAEMEKNINYSLFNSTVNVRFGMTVAYAELRALPSHEPLFSSLDTLDLDRMQITQLDLASPLAIL